MATKLQRKILWEMRKAGGKAIFQLGHKSTDFLGIEKTTGAIVIDCSECVYFGLKTNHFIEKANENYTSNKPEDRIWLIRPEGIKASGLKEPDIRPRYTGGKHGPRWS